MRTRTHLAMAGSIAAAFWLAKFGYREYEDWRDRAPMVRAVTNVVVVTNFIDPQLRDAEVLAYSYETGTFRTSNKPATVKLPKWVPPELELFRSDDGLWTWRYKGWQSWSEYPSAVAAAEGWRITREDNMDHQMRRKWTAVETTRE